MGKHGQLQPQLSLDAAWTRLFPLATPCSGADAALLQTGASAATPVCSKVGVAMILGDRGLSATRAVILQVDDLGASHSANESFLDLARAERVTCGSVIVPGSWF